MKETEGKILDIDVAATMLSLEAIGAEFEFEKEFDAIYFSHASLPLASGQQVLRLRKEGDSVVLTFKGQADNALGSVIREEHEVGLDDWKAGRTVLEALGFSSMKRMRKIRRQYNLDGAHIVLDTYLDDHSFIPPFIEIEAADESEVLRIAGLLGHPPSALRAWTAADLVRHYQS